MNFLLYFNFLLNIFFYYFLPESGPANHTKAVKDFGKPRESKYGVPYASSTDPNLYIKSLINIITI